MGELNNDAFDKWMSMDGEDITIEVTRGTGAQDRDGLSSSISSEAMTSLQQQMTMWLISRILRYENDTGLMPQVVTLDLKAHLSA